jgi:hypothetical protein
LRINDAAPPAPNGIALPESYQTWRLIAPSHHTDKNHVRAIFGNDIAIEACAKAKTSPWPEGAILAKPVWKDKTDMHWLSATVPGEFVHAEFMVKDTRFAQECCGCHAPVKQNGYVFNPPGGNARHRQRRDKKTGGSPRPFCSGHSRQNAAMSCRVKRLSSTTPVGTSSCFMYSTKPLMLWVK